MFGPNIKLRAEKVLAEGVVPDFPDEMRVTFSNVMEEHNIDESKYLS